MKVVINLMFGGKNYENSKPRAGFLSWIGPKGLTLHKRAQLHFYPTIKTSRQSFSTVTHSIQVFGSLQARSSGLGHCKRDSVWYF